VDGGRLGALVHALEHACLLWFGTLLWLGLIGPLAKGAVGIEAPSVLLVRGLPGDAESFGSL
jgi:hypothetical protein